ncbi:DUF998 domain-containing protein [Catellatospora bangladeshensis]|uniref:DUF998 domain-containing protein n=1 Tax=Catellatospora bangladeshensis TaxID=310355 RepID=A0A8J3NKM8_9ACTN|nr:DUF998 domain-containing protein [Catellatospora bangladeshensis]GIF82841.1 hypothetical protein Cba03nite_41900 [Catellatospora bangladeshensis]
MFSDRSRVAAGLAVVCAAAGTGAVMYALGVLPEPWTRGYISEGGVATSPRDGIYRAGIVALAASLALLGTALRRLVPFVFAILATAGVFGTASAAVSCTPGCPLPPYEPSTPADLVHAGASVLGVGLAVVAMTAVALISLQPVLRRTARMFAAVTLPLAVLLVFGLLAIGRGLFTSVLERVALVPVVLWIAVTGLQLLRRPAAERA